MCLLHQGGVRRLSCMMSGCLFDVMTSVLTTRIFNGCEVLFENSVMRVTVRHHEACKVMRNSYPRDRIFNLHRRTIMDSFSCILLLRRGARWLSGRVSDTGARGPGFETYRRRVVSLSKTLYSPKVLVNYPGSDGSVPIWLKNCWLGR